MSLSFVQPGKNGYLLVPLDLIYFPFSKIWGTALSPKDTTTTTELSAVYFHMIQYWLDKHCQGLKNHEGWQMLYVWLVHSLSELMKKKSKLTKIDYKNVLVPPDLPDVLQVCRLMFQAISNIRIGICDGQHRMGAMLHALFNWEINANYPVAEDQPPCTFRRIECTTELPDDGLEGVLLCLSEKVMVRVFVPKSIAEFQEQSVAYSLAREFSQRAHKPRVLPNM
jgi:hypothetical protein